MNRYDDMDMFGREGCHLPKVSSVHLLRTSSSERILTVSFRFAVSVLLSGPQKVEETSHVTVADDLGIEYLGYQGD